MEEVNTMDIADWILLISAIVIVVGWFVNSLLNRRHEIAKKRLDYRLDMLQSFIRVFLKIKLQGDKMGAEWVDQLSDIQTKFHMYGKKDEIKKIDELINSISRKHYDRSYKSLNDLTDLVRSRLRRELGIK